MTMQHLQDRPTRWVQVDAGIWSKPARSGRVEICFATDVDGSHIYDVVAYDDSDRPAEALSPAVAFRDFNSAQRAGDDLAEKHISARRLN
ncbi:MAG: hypothetical protein P4L98_13035 [Ancalomicrobiaceae bacterium]|nr:hypothetical protein [Ancalomicrobiaceae bacterium]